MQYLVASLLGKLELTDIPPLNTIRLDLLCTILPFFISCTPCTSSWRVHDKPVSLCYLEVLPPSHTAPVPLLTTTLYNIVHPRLSRLATKHAVRAVDSALRYNAAAHGSAKFVHTADTVAAIPLALAARAL